MSASAQSDVLPAGARDVGFRDFLSRLRNPLRMRPRREHFDALAHELWRAESAQRFAAQAERLRREVEAAQEAVGSCRGR